MSFSYVSLALNSHALMKYVNTTPDIWDVNYRKVLWSSQFNAQNVILKGYADKKW
jgi:hypothetical protein